MKMNRAQCLALWHLMSTMGINCELEVISEVSGGIVVKITDADLDNYRRFTLPRTGGNIPWEQKPEPTTEALQEDLV